MLFNPSQKFPVYLNKEEILNKTVGYKKADLYNYPEIYDLVYSTKKTDIDFYKSVSRNRKTLYLGIGTGRMFNALGSENNFFIGVDNSEKMLASLYEHFPQMDRNKAILGDAFDTNLFNKETFEVVIAPHSFFSQFTAKEVCKIFSNINFWLKPDGVFCWDIFSPFLNPPFTYDFEAIKSIKTKDYGITYCVSYDHINQRSSECTLVDNFKTADQILLKVDLYYFYPAECMRMLEDCGFCPSISNLLKDAFSIEDEDIAFTCHKV